MAKMAFQIGSEIGRYRGFPLIWPPTYVYSSEGYAVWTSKVALVSVVYHHRRENESNRQNYFCGQLFLALVGKFGKIPIIGFWKSILNICL